MPVSPDNVIPFRRPHLNPLTKAQKLLQLLDAYHPPATEAPNPASETAHRKPGPDRRAPDSPDRGPDRRTDPPPHTITTPQGSIVVYGNHTSILHINQPCTIYIGTAPPPLGNAATGTRDSALIDSRISSETAQQLTPPDEKKGDPIKPRSPSIILKSRLRKISCKFRYFFTISAQILFPIQLAILFNQINHLQSFCRSIYMCENDCLPTQTTRSLNQKSLLAIN
ncbi:MAG: hypothetical protein ABI606_07800 [Rhodoferax sp.]